MATDIEEIAATVSDLAAPGMKPKALFKAVREKHSAASKQDVIRAAFYAVIAQADADPEKATRLQAMAIAERASDEAVDDEPRKKSKKRKADRSQEVRP